MPALPGTLPEINPPDRFEIFRALIVALVIVGLREMAYNVPELVRLPERVRVPEVVILSMAVTPCGMTRFEMWEANCDVRVKVPPTALPELPSTRDWVPVCRSWVTATASARVRTEVGVII